MSVSVAVHLLSGKSASLEVEADASIESLKDRAQSALGTGRGRLLNSSGSTNCQRREAEEWRRAHTACEPSPD